MKQFLTVTTFFLLVNSANAGDWAQYEYLGNCIVHSQEADAKLDFYALALDLSSKKTATGFFTLTASFKDKSEILGGYDTTYTINEGFTAMEVALGENGEKEIIPFGENVEVESDGQKLICNTKLP